MKYSINFNGGFVRHLDFGDDLIWVKVFLLTSFKFSKMFYVLSESIF